MVKQTTVLIAHLSTSAGLRAPLAHLADQVFRELARDLEQQGVGKKVVADMFGMALRSFQQKVNRIEDSKSVVGRTLWEAVLDFITQHEGVTRFDVLTRFRHDDEATVRAVLNDMVESGLLELDGRGLLAAYSIDTREQPKALGKADSDEADEALVWVAVYRLSPVPLSVLREELPYSSSALREALDALIANGRVEEEERDGGPIFSSRQFDSPVGEEAAWCAAVFDHFQAVVSALIVKLQSGTATSGLRDKVGGSTYSFDVWEGHEFEDEVYALLAKQRAEVGALWERVREANQSSELPPTNQRVTFYLGQSVVEQERCNEPVTSDESGESS